MSRNKFLYTGSLMTDAQPAGNVIRKFLLPKNSPIYLDAYAFDCVFQCKLDSVFPPAPKNTPANNAAFHSTSGDGLNDANAILVDYSHPKDMGGGIGEWVGTFARVPAPWDDFKTQAVTFPGWINTLTSGAARGARTRNVKVRERYTYYVVDPASILSGQLDSGGSAISTVASMGIIPTAVRTPWLNTNLSGTIANCEANDLVPIDGVTIGSLFYFVTMPSTDGYINMIANAATVVGTSGTPPSAAWTDTFPLKWNGTTDPTTSGGGAYGQYQFADAVVRVYAGNIIEVCTSWVIPQ